MSPNLNHVSAADKNNKDGLFYAAGIFMTVVFPPVTSNESSWSLGFLGFFSTLYADYTDLQKTYWSMKVFLRLANVSLTELI